MDYSEEDMLMLSGIQHYVFCPRQWALIHIEQQWEENGLTIEGMLLHEHVDNPSYRNKYVDKVIIRRVAIASHTLGLNGFSDAVELLPADTMADAIKHPRYAGCWKPMPVEYKRGHCKPNRCDEVQVAAQAICLEEMYGISIQEGMIFYNEEKGRQEVVIDDELRRFTKKCADEMHQIFQSGVTPPADYQPHCKSCSLYNLCVPELCSKQNVKGYLADYLYEKTS